MREAPASKLIQSVNATAAVLKSIELMAAGEGVEMARGYLKLARAVFIPTAPDKREPIRAANRRVGGRALCFPARISQRQLRLQPRAGFRKTC